MIRNLAMAKLTLDSEVSSSTQGGAMIEEDEGDNAGFEKKMKSSILTTLKAKFVNEHLQETSSSPKQESISEVILID